MLGLPFGAVVVLLSFLAFFKKALDTPGPQARWHWWGFGSGIAFDALMRQMTAIGKWWGETWDHLLSPPIGELVPGELSIWVRDWGATVLVVILVGAFLNRVLGWSPRKYLAKRKEKARKEDKAGRGGLGGGGKGGGPSLVGGGRL